MDYLLTDYHIICPNISEIFKVKYFQERNGKFT
jgi:hypothetical protein